MGPCEINANAISLDVASPHSENEPHYLRDKMEQALNFTRMSRINMFQRSLIWGLAILTVATMLTPLSAVLALHEQNPGTDSIHGRVIDGSGRPVAGVQVHICASLDPVADPLTCVDQSSSGQVTNSNGHWWFNFVQPNYNYTAWTYSDGSNKQSVFHPENDQTMMPLITDDRGLGQPVNKLSVNIGGNGQVHSSVSGIACGTDTPDNCDYYYLEGTHMSLMATADTGYTFSGWSGPCTNGLAQPSCDLYLTADTVVSANFSGGGSFGTQNGEISGFVRDAGQIAQQNKKVRIAKLDGPGGAVLETWDVLTVSDGRYVQTGLYTEYDYKVYMPLRSDETPSEHLVHLSATNPAVGNVDFTIPTETSEAADPPASGVLSGTVTDSATNEPVSGLQVKVEKRDSTNVIIASWQLLTDGLGNYAIDGLPLGYTYHVYVSGLSEVTPASYDTFLSTSVPSETDLDFAVLRDSTLNTGSDGIIFGYLYDVDGDPIPEHGVRVHVTGQPTIGETVTTNSSGKFIVDGLTWPKEYRINPNPTANFADVPDQFRYLGYNPEGVLVKTKRADFVFPEDVVMDTVEEPADGEDGTLKGVFKLPDGTLAKNVAIEVFAYNGVEHHAVSVDQATAAFEMSLPPDIWFVGYKVLDENYAPLTPPNGEMVVQAGSVHDAVLTIQRNPSTLTVTVKAADSTVMPGVWVEVSRFSITAETDETESDLSTLEQEQFGKLTDTAGKAIFKVPSGTWFVRVHAPYDPSVANPKETKIVIDSGVTKSLELQFRSRDSKLLGRVLNNATGLPVDAFVGAWSESGAFAETRANTDGYYEMNVLGGDVWHVGAMANINGILHVARPVDVPVDLGASVTQNLIVKQTEFAIPPPVSVTHDAAATFEEKLSNGTSFACETGGCFGSAGEQVALDVFPDVEAPNQGGTGVIGMAYEILAKRSGQDVSSLNNPARIKIPYTDSDISESGVLETDLKIGYYNEATGTWVELDDCAVDKAQNLVTCTTDHLTRFALLTPAYTTVVGPTINEGDLVRGPDGVKVWIVNEHGYKRHIFNPAVFNMYGHFIWNNIVEVSQTTLDSYVTSDLYRALGDTQVFSLEEIDEAAGLANKRWLNFSAEEFASRGYVPEQIFEINPVERDFYQEGDPIL